MIVFWKRGKVRSAMHRIILTMLIVSMCVGVVSEGLNSGVAYAASEVTETQLFMQVPQYLNNPKLDEYYTRCTGYCYDAIGTVSDTDTIVASALYGFKSGAKFLVKEAGSQLGITSSNFDSTNKEVAGELLKEYFSVEDNIMDDASEITEDYKYITKTYNAFSSSIIEDFKAANKKRKYIVYPDEYIDELFQDQKLTGKILDNFGNAQEGLEVFMAIVEMNQLELQEIDQLIAVTKVDSSLQKGLIEIRNDITDDLPGYLVRNYLNDKAIDKLTKCLQKATAGHISGGASMIVGLLADVTYSIYSKFKPSLSDIMYTTLLDSYTSSAGSAVTVLERKFCEGNASEADIDNYRVAYNFYVATLKFWMKKCSGLLKNGNARLKSKLNVYGDSLSSEINYDFHLKICLANANQAVKDGIVKITEEKVIKYTSSGRVIDDTYDSKESIAAKFAVIQSKYKPNVGQTWTGSYNRCIQCCGFAQLVFNSLFGYDLSGYYGDRRYMIRDENKAIKVGQLIGSDVTTDNVKSLFSKAQLGDFVQMDGSTYGQHSAIFVSADDTGVTLYDCNSKPHGETTDYLINQWKITWANWIKWYGNPPSKRQNGISVYHATNYAEIYGDGSDLFYDDTANFVIENGVLKKYNGWQAHVVIPEEVTEIGDGAFKNNTTMISIEIPDTVIKIGNEAFYGCTSLAAIYIPDSVEEIGSSVFYNDSSLSSVHLPENEKYISISSSMFSSCCRMSEIVIPDNIVQIDSYSFQNCVNLKTVDMADSVTSIGQRAFWNDEKLSDVKMSKGLVSFAGQSFGNCNSLTEVFIPKSIETGGGYSYYGMADFGPFYECTSLKTIEFEDGITSIPSLLFSYCKGIEEMDIPDTVTAIGSYTFQNCTNLKTIDISDSVTSIGQRAFWNDEKLSDVKMSKGLVSFAGQSFGNCNSLTEVFIPKSIETGGGYSYYGMADMGPFYECTSLKTIEFEDGITSIPSLLFSYCKGIEEMDIPDTVTAIGSYAFQNCANLKTIDISDSVTSIGQRAFWNDERLSNVKMSKGLVSFGGQSFGNCNALEEIIIPKSIQVGGSYSYYGMADMGPFYACTSLKKIEFENGITTIPALLFSNCAGIETVTIPDSVTEIGKSAFSNCTELKKIIIPSTVKTMGTHIFYGCKSLQSVQLPDDRKTIPDSTFANCIALNDIYFPTDLETIGNSAFYNCTSLKEVNLPGKLVTINGSAFYGCISIEKLMIPSSVKTINSSAFSHCESLTDLTISEGITTISAYAFEYNKMLESVIFPDTLQAIGESAFRYCDILNNVHWGAGIKIVPKYCFYEDPELVSVVLPQQVTKVDEFAFGNCTKFTDITMNRNVSSAALNAFSYPAKLTIHGVPGTYAETFANDNSIKFDALKAKTTAIKLNKKELELGRGYTEILTAAITPEDSVDEFTWTSTDEDVVTVDADGKIKAVSGGEASIIAMSGDVMEICEVTVYEPVSSVYLDKSSYTGTTGDTLQLTANVYPNDATYKDVTWSSDNNTVASVDSNGLVTLGKYGTANVTVTTKDMSRTAKCTITVKGIDVTGVSLSEKKTTIQVGQQKTLEAIIAPENATNKNVTWSSTKTAVATVNNGVVTGVSTGTAIIMVKTEDGAKTASCTVTVEEAADVVSQNADVVFDSEVDDDGTKTVDPVSFNIYNNTDEAITGVEATLDKGEAFSVELPDTIAANDSIVITIIPNEDLSVGVYEDIVTIVAGENTINIPIKLEIKAKNNSAGENQSGEGGKENEKGEDKEKEGDNDQGGNNPSEGNGGTSQEIKDKTDNGTGNNSATDTQQTPAGTNNQPTSQPGNTPAQTTIPSVTPTPAVSDQPAQPTTGIKVSKPSKVTLSLAKNSAKKTIKVSWKKITAAGFEVQMALNNKFTKSKKTYSTTKTSLSVKKLKKGKTYYVRVRAFNKDGSKKLYGSWSKTKKVKIKK